MLLEDHFPKIEKLIKDKLGKIPTKTFQNDELMRISFRKLYQSMPKMFRIAIGEKKFEDFCMSNREKLLNFGDTLSENISKKDTKNLSTKDKKYESDNNGKLNKKKLQKTFELLETAKNVFLPVYSPDLILVKAKNSIVWDSDGNEYIDFGSGISVNSLGHKNYELLATIKEQSEKLLHVSNLFLTEPSIELADYLVKSTFGDRVFFCNSGAEANEAAIKIARKFTSMSFPLEKREIITFEGSFHGRTLATLTATAQPKYQKGFEPLPEGFSYCPFNDFDAISKLISEKTCAVMVEPIQGEGGVNPTKSGFLSHLRKLCDKHNALLIFDEVQCGMGRTGKLFAYEWECSNENNQNLKPDILTMAKSLGGGLPIGAMLCTEKVGQSFTTGDHGSTFGGNPLITSVALTTLKKINSKIMLDEITKKGELLREHLNTLNGEINVFQEIRGKGMMIGGILKNEIDQKATEIVNLSKKNGLLVLSAGANVLRLLPPLNISENELKEGIKRLSISLKEFKININY